MHTINVITTACFVIEALMKIIAQGFVLNHAGSYLRDGWNVIDFIVVLTSLIDIFLDKSKSIQITKVLRMFRVGRPIRLIS